MGSFKGYGRPEQPSRRRNQKSTKRNDRPRLEMLEERRLLSTTPDSTIPAPLWTPTTTNLFDVQHGPMANLGQTLIGIYQSYVQTGGSTSQLAAENPRVEFNNGMVGIQVKSLGGSFTSFVTQLQDVGMQVTDTSTLYGVATGWAPVNELPTIAEMQQTMAGMPLDYPVYHYQGEADNEALASTFADVAQTEFNVTGQGVTIGVISDSVNQYPTAGAGLPESYGTGDLNPNNPVDVLGDGPSGSTDEGRAMLENIHDIAPGANLAFDTAGDSDLAFSQAITALATTGKANEIVDDVSFSDEPLFQDGYAGQSIDAVTAQGVTYFSAAGNQANGGYLSNWRPATGTVTGVGSGTFENFNPNGGTLLELPITTTNPNIPLVMQFDQPYNFQEPAGDPNVDTSTVNFYLLNSSGTVVASSTNNDVAFDAPFQSLTTPAAGNYFIAMELVSGPNPGHVEFYDADDTNELTVDTQSTYGSAGGTYYPTSAGHETNPNTIGVGATPWWAPAPFLGQNPLASEPFSSDGPGLYVFNADGSAMATPILSLDPTVTAPDGGNTSFFSPGNVINTSNTPPEVPGEPSTSTNLSQNLPSFFGTSSAAPNAAAVAALDAPGGSDAHARRDPRRTDRIGVEHAVKRLEPGSVGPGGWIRTDQRGEGHQRRRPAAGRVHRSVQRRDGDDDTERGHRHLQQAGELHDGRGG